MYDVTSLHMSTPDDLDTVIARAETWGFTTEPWEVTAHRASITSTEVWLRISGESTAITFTVGGQTAAFPVISCPTAPSNRRP